ncbi:unnamed protein product, partial [Discosporangium mesarthrocarpum]
IQGYRLPPWKERPPQEAPSYKSPDILMARDNYMQASLLLGGGGLENYHVLQAQIQERRMAMHAGS